VVRSSILVTGIPVGLGGFPFRGKMNSVNNARIKLARKSDIVVKNGNTSRRKKGVIRIIAVSSNIKAALFSFSQNEIIMVAINTTDRIIPKKIRIFCNMPGVSFSSKIQKMNICATFLNINRLLIME